MLDLDPKQAPWKNVLEVALVCKEVLDELGLPAFPKTSGSSGIHIYLPLKPKHDYRKVAAIAEGLAAEVARRAPKIATIQRSLAKRQKQQVYVDAMQNARGKTIAAAFSARAKRRRDGFDAADLETDRKRREDFRLHDRECCPAY